MPGNLEPMMFVIPLLGVVESASQVVSHTFEMNSFTLLGKQRLGRSIRQ